MAPVKAFWLEVPLSEMTSTQWEQLCDGCGKCCLHKLEDEDTGELHFTSVACRYLDCQACRCKVYDERLARVPDCVKLTPCELDALIYMPSTCAYRLLHEGRELPEWHPLVSGDPNSVHRAQVSVRGKVISEDRVQDDELEHYIIEDL